MHQKRYAPKVKIDAVKADVSLGCDETGIHGSKREFALSRMLTSLPAFGKTVAKSYDGGKTEGGLLSTPRQ